MADGAAVAMVNARRIPVAGIAFYGVAGDGIGEHRIKWTCLDAGPASGTEIILDPHNSVYLVPIYGTFRARFGAFRFVALNTKHRGIRDDLLFPNGAAMRPRQIEFAVFRHTANQLANPAPGTEAFIDFDPAHETPAFTGFPCPSQPRRA